MSFSVFPWQKVLKASNREVWKRSCRLAVEVYRQLEHCRDFGLKDQMTRAAVSIASNIAEGLIKSKKLNP